MATYRFDFGGAIRPLVVPDSDDLADQIQDHAERYLGPALRTVTLDLAKMTGAIRDGVTRGAAIPITITKAHA